ncbi:MAG TPA: 5-(carboxyamino)imidazole ribonucleotide mutase [Candidatus Rothia avistercoris]|uniref:N5-carboxyaminoimidazole ribonucleotide mutase n=1 Tax=Candidatus Rothia avistercoris TaxID=2840479 RepID=A0A9D2ZSR1_9MICC|nr:5-(carboxyamino)imidazole ribonucleotide mutase [Rothia nasimurium]HJD50871.1 5-(carboxyamino)imidazole ribonucleotide mutase [Candidatus Rothia avistercoris]
MTSPYDSNKPIVGIVMGSDSDWPVMEAAAEVLEEFGIPYEADVVSAHRMPEDMIAYGREAADRGIRVIIAGAGGAAHLPGMLASVTPLPVIGVPVKLKSLDGMDSLLSIVQMPAGVPVATVSINGARNAGLLALRMLGSGSDGFARQVRSDLVDFAASLRQTAMDKGAALRAKVEEHKAELDGEGAAPSAPAQSLTAPAHNDERDGQQKTPYAP